MTDIAIRRIVTDFRVPEVLVPNENSATEGADVQVIRSNRPDLRTDASYLHFYLTQRIVGAVGNFHASGNTVFHTAAIAQHISRHWGEQPLRMLGSLAITGTVFLMIGIFADRLFAVGLRFAGCLPTT